MTIMIPNNYVGTCPVAQVLYKNLDKQLGCNDKVVQYLSPNNRLLGALFWVQHKSQSLFIYLVDSSESSMNLEGFGLQKNSEQLNEFLKNGEIPDLLSLQQQLLPKIMRKHCHELAPFVVINPYANNKSKHFAIKSRGLFFFGKDLIKSDKLGVLINRLLGMAGSKLLNQHIRSVFNCELIICNDDGGGNSSSPLNVKESLLDDNQELAIKTNIVSCNTNYQNDNCVLTSVSGGVSSGKTESLIKRTELITQLYPKSKIVIIAANSASKASLRERYGKKSSDKSIEIYSFYEWCKQQWSKLQIQSSKHLVEEAELVSLIEVQLKKHLEDNNISQYVFLQELEFIYGRKIFYEKEYLSSQAVARPYALDSAQFTHIWRAILTLKNELSLRNWLLPARVPQLFWDKLQEMPEQVCYDYILVDDADFLPPIAFDLFKKLIKPESGQLFVTLNSYLGGQGINQSWGDEGIEEATGQNIGLVNSYQVNPAILNAANAFLQNRMSDYSQQLAFDNDFYDVEESVETPLPRLLHFLLGADENNRLLNEIKERVHNGCKPEEILIICNDNEISQLTTLIGETLNIPVDNLNDFYFISHQKRKGLGICNYLQAQGLTASYVFVFGLSQLFVGEKVAEKDEAEQYQAKRRQNTRLITQAMTRARKELTLFLVAEEIPQAFINAHIKIPTSGSDNNDTSVVCYLRKLG